MVSKKIENEDLVEGVAGEQSFVDGALTTVPSITLEHDDIADRHSRNSSAAHKTKIESANMLPERLDRAGKNYPLILGSLAIALFVALAGVIYLYNQVKKTQQQLATATARVEQLEVRLVTTDTTLTKSEVLLAAKLKTMDGQINTNMVEIRKLWALADKNTKGLQAQNAELQLQKPVLQAVVEQASQTANQVATDSALLKNVDGTVKEAIQRLEIAQENISEQSGEIKTLRDKQSAMSNNHGKRLTNLEDTAKSTDVFRRNTLDELRRLKEEINNQQTIQNTKQPQ